MTSAWRRAWPGIRHWLYWTHRWLGIGGCLLFVMWFVSGVVMMYVGYPNLTDEERLAGLAPLRFEQAAVSPTAALDALPQADRAQPPRRMVLEMQGGINAEPVWRIVDASGGRHTVSARDGHVPGPVDAAQAEAIARAFSGHVSAHWAETLERDQWTVPQGLNPLRPLHRIEVGDAAGTELYVSQRNGEVVRDTTRSERFWNWLGSVPHWIYFTPLRADPPLWHDVVVWLSAACIVSAVTGIVIGILRVRLRRRFRNGAVTPYSGWMAWHHIAGLIGGFFVLTWIISGWLSMNPNGWFQRGPGDAVAMARYTGADTSPFPWPPAVLPSGEGDAAPREAVLLWFDGKPLLQLRDSKAHVRVVDAATGGPAVIGKDDILRAAARLRPGAITQATLQTREDFHWYGHHRERIVPVWRLQFDDPARSWIYIDPASGQVAGSNDSNSRLRRWLFNAAHSLDFPWLIQYRPAWDLVVWLLSIVGAVASASGVVIGWRRLRRKPRPSAVSKGLAQAGP
ncbi:PepSY domain-containing protein [Variovorax paradoxus]|uniref:PepSY domain-containing protein n=1 Tax=Variovorax paradoxus TaxID=34073 RepID=UPI0021ACF8C7|nr:PepSY domain-containing protein [Variovorax paradoxus]UVH55025.1 PepSY domain-containing protein [Variovorax paradoxus]